MVHHWKTLNLSNQFSSKAFLKKRLKKEKKKKKVFYFKGNKQYNIMNKTENICPH